MSKKDSSFGVVPVLIDDAAVSFLIIQNKSFVGHWSFPKGHLELNESPVDAAVREFSEETGIDSSILQLEKSKSFSTYYRFFSEQDGNFVDKTVTYFLGYLSEKSVVNIQEQEIKNYAWLSYEEAFTQLTYDNDKKILQEVYATLS